MGFPPNAVTCAKSRFDDTDEDADRLLLAIDALGENFADFGGAEDREWLLGSGIHMFLNRLHVAP